MIVDLEAEYNNRARVPGHPAIMAGWTRDAAAYRTAHATARLGLRYGPSPRQTLDLFPPERPAAGAAVLFIHGGYWQALGPAEFSHLARGANAGGLAFAVAGYDLCPDVTVSTILDQIRVAAVTLHRLTGRAIVAAGHSAGGHLAAGLVATDWTAVDPALPADLVPAGLAISGLFDLVPLLPTSINTKLGLTAAEAQRLSPLHWPVSAGRAVDAWVGAAESNEYHRQAREFVATWSGRGVAVRLATVPGADHFTVIDPLADAGSAMTRRLVELARGTRQGRASG